MATNNLDKQPAINIMVSSSFAANMVSIVIATTSHFLRHLAGTHAFQSEHTDNNRT
jgi:hypothetical protein